MDTDKGTDRDTDKGADRCISSLRREKKQLESTGLYHMCKQMDRESVISGLSSVKTLRSPGEFPFGWIV